MSAGLLWGAYHFGTAGDGAKQVDHFLEAASPTEGTLLALELDLDQNGTDSMTLDQACAFVLQIKKKIGVWPGLYSNAFIDDFLGGNADSTLRHCWFWRAQYDAGPPKVHPTWKTWTLWQYTDGANGTDTDSVPGIGPCDRDRFNGGPIELTEFWTSGGLAMPPPPPLNAANTAEDHNHA